MGLLTGTFTLLATTNSRKSMGDGDTRRASLYAVGIEGIAGGTVVKLRGTINRTDYYDILLFPLDSATGATSASADGIYRIDASGLVDVEGFISTTGTGTVTLYPSPVIG